MELMTNLLPLLFDASNQTYHQPILYRSFLHKYGSLHSLFELCTGLLLLLPAKETNMLLLNNC